MNPQISQEINFLRDMLQNHNDVGIIVGNHQTIDTMASSLALYLSLSQSGKQVQIVSLKDPIVELSNLVGIDKVKKTFAGNTTKLVVSLPYKKGEVEKVLFTEAPSTINFHLTAAEGKSITPFDIKDVHLNWEGGAPGFIIAVGVGTIDEFSQIIDINNTKIVNIDNYPQNTRFGDVVLVDESFSSLSEVVGKIIKDLSLPLNIDSAQNLLDGVLFATRNFTKPNTSPFAFETASSAMYQGAQRRENRDNNRGGQREQGQTPREPMQPQRSNPQQQRQRVNENDFPAMHMQNRPQQPQMPRRPQSALGQRPQPQMPRPQNTQPQMSPQDIINKIRQETPVRQPQPQVEPVYEEGQFDAISSQAPEPMDNNSMPFDNEPPFPPQPQENAVSSQNTEEIPDDWLMPKVFKSSKNQN